MTGIVDNRGLLAGMFTLLVVCIAFIRLCVLTRRPAMGRRGAIAILLLAVVLVMVAWGNHLHNEIVADLYLAAALVLIVTAVRIGTTSPAGAHQKPDASPKLLRRKNTRKWQLIGGISYLVAVFSWVYLAHAGIPVPVIVVYGLWSIWAICLIAGLGTMLHIITRVGLIGKNDSFTGGSIRLLWHLLVGFARTLVGLGNRQALFLFVSGNEKDAALANRINHAKYIRTESFVAAGVWLVWGILSGIVMGLHKHDFVLLCVLLFALYIPAVLIVAARNRGLLP